MFKQTFHVRDMMRRMILCRASLAGVFLSIVLCTANLGMAYGGQARYRPLSLDHGTLRGYQWAVGLKRDDGKLGAQRPCLISQITDTRRSGTGENDFTSQSGLSSCSALVPTNPPNDVSLTVGEGNREVTVVGMAFASQVTSAYLDFGTDRHIRVRLKKLNGVQIRNAGVRSIRYAAFSLTGNRCLRQVKGYGAKGNEIYRGPIDECPEF